MWNNVFEISTDCLFVKTATEKPRRGDTDLDESSSDDGDDEDDDVLHEDGGKLRDSDLESEMDLEEENEESGEEEEEEEEDSGEGKWRNVQTYSRSGRPPLITISPLKSQKSMRDQDPDYRPDED